MKLCIKERNDSSELMSMFNKLKKKGYGPMWNDPYCEFVVTIDGVTKRYHQENNGKLTITNVNF